MIRNSHICFHVDFQESGKCLKPHYAIRGELELKSFRVLSGAEQVPSSGVNDPSFNDLENEDADQWQGDLGGEATWEEPSVGVGVGVSSHQGNGAENWDKGVAENVEATKRTEREVVDEVVDPWEPLNPHEPGILTIRPYRQGTFS